jgi:hypothetical protein
LGYLVLPVMRTEMVLVTRTEMVLVTRTAMVLVTRTEMVLDALIHSPSSHLTRLLDRESFIEFSHRESFKL